MSDPMEYFMDNIKRHMEKAYRKLWEETEEEGFIIEELLSVNKVIEEGGFDE